MSAAAEFKVVNNNFNLLVTNLLIGGRLGGSELLYAALDAGGLMMLSFIKPYPAANRPTRASVYGSAWASEKQRRWFFWALGKGLIDVPYRRGTSRGSERLSKSWSTKRETGLALRIGTNVSYARWVKAEEQQSKYMKAVGWTTIEADIERGRPQVFNAMNHLIQKRFLGM